jgi:hypothetical protein
MPEEKTCFVIAPIGEPESDIRKRSDQILKHIISPAVKQCGYESLRADKISEPGIITSQVIQHVVEDSLVIADLTGRNPNVFYELAIRHAIKKPLVQIIKKGEAIPFDVAGTRTVHVDHHDLDSVEEAKAEIIKQIRSVEKDPAKVDTPISVALDLQILRQSENPEERSLADMVSAVSELRTSILTIEKKLGDPKSLIPPDYFEFLSRKFSHNLRRPSAEFQELRVLTRELMAIVESKRYSETEKNRIKKLAAYLYEMTNRIIHGD